MECGHINQSLHKLAFLCSFILSVMFWPWTGHTQARKYIVVELSYCLHSPYLLISQHLSPRWKTTVLVLTSSWNPDSMSVFKNTFLQAVPKVNGMSKGYTKTWDWYKSQYLKQSKKSKPMYSQSIYPKWLIPVNKYTLNHILPLIIHHRYSLMIFCTNQSTPSHQAQIESDNTLQYGVPSLVTL